MAMLEIFVNKTGGNPDRYEVAVHWHGKRQRLDTVWTRARARGLVSEFLNGWLREDEHGSSIEEG